MTIATIIIRSAIAPMLAVGLFASSAAVFAKEGINFYPVSAQERQQIVPGMTADQVEQLLGKTFYVKSYARSADTAWVYRSNEVDIRARLEVEFGGDGKVKGTRLVRADGKAGSIN